MMNGKSDAAMKNPFNLFDKLLTPSASKKPMIQTTGVVAAV